MANKYILDIFDADQVDMRGGVVRRAIEDVEKNASRQEFVGEAVKRKAQWVFETSSELIAIFGPYKVLYPGGITTTY